jgi:hypothetical protein
MAGLAILVKNKKYMKKVLLIAGLILCLASCSTYRKVQVIKDALSKNDSANTELISKKAKIDSAAIVKGIIQKIELAKINFTTMNARFKVDYETLKNADNYIVNASIQKGKAIYLTVRGAMGVIGLKAFINKDSVILVYPLSKKVERKPLSFLQEVLKIPFTYTTVEDLMVGNPIFMDNTNIVSYKNTNGKLQVGLMGALFKNLIILNEDNTKIVHLKLDDVDINQHRTCDISYSDHTLYAGFQFPQYRDISIAANNKLEVHMEVKEFGFDEPLKYTFAIPKPGKRK